MIGVGDECDWQGNYLILVSGYQSDFQVISALMNSEDVESFGRIRNRNILDGCTLNDGLLTSTGQERQNHKTTENNLIFYVSIRSSGSPGCPFILSPL